MSCSVLVDSSDRILRPAQSRSAGSSAELPAWKYCRESREGALGRVKDWSTSLLRRGRELQGHNSAHTALEGGRGGDRARLSSVLPVSGPGAGGTD